MHLQKLLLTHTDLDGVSCAIIAQYFRYFDSHIYFADYAELELNDEKFKSYLAQFEHILITDLSIPQVFIDFLEEYKIDYHILDHHDSSDYLIPNINAEIVHGVAGTKLLFDYIMKTTPKRIPIAIEQFVKLVNVYDLWSQTDPLWPYAKKLNAIMYQMLRYNREGYDKYRDFISLQLLKLRTQSTFEFTPLEKEKIVEAEKKEARNLESARSTYQERIDSKGNLFALFMVSANISNISSTLLQENSKLIYSVCINTYSKAYGKISVRSQNNSFDCNWLKDIHGHKQAAGKTVPLTKKEVNDFMGGTIHELGYKESE